jgi:hypothetical protein
MTAEKCLWKILPVFDIVFLVEKQNIIWLKRLRHLERRQLVLENWIEDTGASVKIKKQKRQDYDR